MEKVTFFLLIHLPSSWEVRRGVITLTNIEHYYKKRKPDAAEIRGFADACGIIPEMVQLNQDSGELEIVSYQEKRALSSPEIPPAVRISINSLSEINGPPLDQVFLEAVQAMSKEEIEQLNRSLVEISQRHGSGGH